MTLEQEQRSSTEVSPDGERGTRRLGRLAIALGVAWLLVGLVGLHSVREPGALSFGLKRGWAVQYLPEWWGFFTADATRAEVVPYRHTSHGWVKSIAYPNGAAQDFLGWRRKGRSQSYDLDRIITAMSPSMWRRCTHADTSCLDDVQQTHRVVITGLPILCGRLGLLDVYLVPWQSARKHVTPIAWAAKVVVPCHA
jgi:antimicrobial peptide system SdpA family protein